MQDENTIPDRKINGTFERVQFHPDPILGSEKLTISIVKRFFEKVRKTDSCWLWEGTGNSKTGGVISRGGGGNAGNIAVQRLSWLIHFGGLASTCRVVTSCGDKLCVNPEHIAVSKRSGVIKPAVDTVRLASLLAYDPEPDEPWAQDPTLPPGFSKTFRQRFWEKVKKTDSCWLWIGGFSDSGYGSIGKGMNQPGNIIRANIASWIIHNGPVPEGMCVCHDCPGGDNRACVNPSHLWLGSDADNMEDAKDKRRLALKAHWNAKKLTMEQVKSIRLMSESGTSQKEIALFFGVDPSYISQIVSRERWDRPGC